MSRFSIANFFAIESNFLLSKNSVHFESIIFSNSLGSNIRGTDS